MEQLINLIICSLVVSVASITLTRSRIFSEIRGWIMERSDFFGDLSTCHYCTSHWLSAILISVTGHRIAMGGVVLSFIITWLFVVGVAAIFSRIIND